MMRKNDVLELDILRHTADGQGIAHLPDGRVCFVAGALGGEQCRVQLMKLGKTVAWGRIDARLSTADARQDNDCPYFPKCGGCDNRHMTYAAELEAKRQHVADVMRRIGGIDAGDFVIYGAENTARYRNKAVFPVSGTAQAPRIGFYRARSHDVVNVADCLLQHPAATAARETLAAWMTAHEIPPYDEVTGKGLIRHLLVRTNSSGDALICVLAHGKKLPHTAELVTDFQHNIPGLCGVIFGENLRGDNVILGDHFQTLFGRDFITETLCGIEYKIDVNSFFQTNREQTEMLYKIAADFACISEHETLLDLYCGIGSIGLSMAQKCHSIIGVEAVDAAVKNAQENAASNGIKNAQFFCGDAGEVSLALQAKKMTPDVIVFDPPRKGLSQDTMEACIAMNPSRMVYVSCDPATQARDVKFFAENGYSLTKLAAVDLFPRTKHVECVCFMTKTK